MPVLATKTLEAIDVAIYADQGRLFRHYLRECILDIDDAFDDSEHKKHRAHFGISQSGHECARELYYGFRWATDVRIGGKGLRLFNRGHLEEPRFVAMLRMIGCQVWQADECGKQYRVSLFGGHYGSAIDGVVQGIPEMPTTPVLAEFKTFSDKNFRKLAGELDSYGNVLLPALGVQKVKPEHYAQFQQYMGYFHLTHCLYGAVNKNTDEIYFELVPYDQHVDEGYKERSHRIIFAREAPPRISNNPSFWRCRFCDHRKVCHYNATPDFNCRTCANSQPLEDGTWRCNLHNCTLDFERQLVGCPDWAEYPDFQT